MPYLDPPTYGDAAGAAYRRTCCKVNVLPRSSWTLVSRLWLTYHSRTCGHAVSKQTCHSSILRCGRFSDKITTGLVGCQVSIVLFTESAFLGFYSLFSSCSSSISNRAIESRLKLSLFLASNLDGLLLARAGKLQRTLAHTLCDCRRNTRLSELCANPGLLLGCA